MCYGRMIDGLGRAGWLTPTASRMSPTYVVALLLKDCRPPSHLSPHPVKPSPSHAQTHLAIHEVYIFCMGWSTSASRCCRAPRTNSPREWGRSRADPEEAVMIKAVIPD